MPSGLGSSPAGSSLAGADGFGATTESVLAKAPRALKYDPRTRTYPMNASGQFLEVHPVDQAVALALTVTAGRIPSAPKQGTRWTALSRKTGAKLQRAAEDVVHDALAPWVRAGDVTLVAVTAAASAPGNNQVAVDYVNNRTQRRQTASVNFG